MLGVESLKGDSGSEALERRASVIRESGQEPYITATTLHRASCAFGGVRSVVVKGAFE